MSAWRSVFLHQFPTSNGYGFFHAVEGQLAFNDSLGGSSPRNFRLREGNWLSFEMADTFADVIGYSVDVRFQLFRVLIPHRVTTLATLDDRQVVVSLVAGDEISPVSLDGEIHVTMAGQTLAVRGLSLPKDGPEFWRVRVRWYTTGQGFIELNGNMAAHHPDFVRDGRLSVSRVSLGALNSSPPNPDLLSVVVNHFHVQLLREDDTKAEIARHLNTELDQPPPIECGKRAQALTRNNLRASRSLMSQFIQANTSPWQQGQPGQPISATAVKLHDASAAAADALLHFVRQDDVDARAQYLNQIRIVFESLAQSDPVQFASLIERSFDAQQTVLSACLPAIDKYREARPTEMAKLQALADDVSVILNEFRGP